MIKDIESCIEVSNPGVALFTFYDAAMPKIDLIIISKESLGTEIM